MSWRGATRGALATAAVVLGLLPACARTLPPLPQATLVVDTDLPVDRLATRLRLDVFAEDGTWIESRDVLRDDPRAWPVSFTLYSPDDRPRAVRVRLRAYPSGLVRDYRGERFEDRPAAAPAAEVLPLPPATDAPRLSVAGADLTPRTEPIPSVTVDRLLAVSLSADAPRVGVLLATACAGMMADLEGGTTCRAVEGLREPIGEADPVPWSSRVGVGFGATRCTAAPRPASTRGDGTPLHDEEVCVPGGLFVFGDPILGNFGPIDGREVSTNPPRLVRAPALRIDRFEFTVARYRAAVAAGFVLGEDLDPPIANDHPFPAAPTDEPTDVCTYSTSPLPGAANREEYGLNCVSWATARALCRFVGADLPTEVHYEWVATAAGRLRKTPYPWGTAPPRCDLQVYGRSRDPIVGGTECSDKPWALPWNPGPVTAGPGDETPLFDGVAVHGLAAGQAEWTRDVFQPMRARCWLAQPMTDPSCQAGDTSRHGSRGTGWELQPFLMVGTARLPLGSLVIPTDMGFRCVRPGAA